MVLIGKIIIAEDLYACTIQKVSLSPINLYLQMFLFGRIKGDIKNKNPFLLAFAEDEKGNPLHITDPDCRDLFVT